MNVYECDQVKQVRKLHQPILSEYSTFKRVKDLLEAFADNLFQSFNKNDKAVAIEISNHHPLFIGNDHEEIMKQAFTFKDAQLTIALEYGFDDWEKIEGLIQEDFEQAIDLLLDGNLNKLKTIESLPLLLKKRSSFGHQASILHYTGSNGVEIWRQKVPENLPEITTWLIKQGADKKAKAYFYGGAHTTLELAATSAHPKDAGISKALEKSLA
ncbi:hypothetical protein [Ekhidna sp.]